MFLQIKHFSRKTFPNVTEKFSRQTDALYPEAIFSTIGGKRFTTDGCENGLLMVYRFRKWFTVNLTETFGNFLTLDIQ